MKILLTTVVLVLICAGTAMAMGGAPVVVVPQVWEPAHLDAETGRPHEYRKAEVNGAGDGGSGDAGAAAGAAGSGGSGSGGSGCGR